MNKNQKRQKRAIYKHVVETTGAPPQYVKPPKGHKAKVARAKVSRWSKPVVEAETNPAEDSEPMRVAIP